MLGDAALHRESELPPGPGALNLFADVPTNCAVFQTRYPQLHKIALVYRLPDASLHSPPDLPEEYHLEGARI
ncbi:unnamed protein product [Allacma fusca]|uniref:Uncharacterized protein n=1 Tax=Allacma fusca TaxID=39272 RepID=A0A8J2P294_9HEXA|nr:unnamed protein product [Allacma fusca]